MSGTSKSQLIPLLAILLTLAALSITAQPPAESPEKSVSTTIRMIDEALLGNEDIERIRKRGQLVMLCYPHQYSAFVRANLAKGPMPKAGPPEHFVGIDVDIMQGFARFLGVSLEVRRASAPRYSSLIPDLLAKKGDLVASSMSMTEERRRRVDFSRPYYSIYPLVVVRSDNDVQAWEDLLDRTVSAIPGSSHEDRLRRLGFSRRQFHGESFMVGNFGAVIDGAADFTLIDSGSAERWVAKNDQLKVAFRLPLEEHYGFAVRKGSGLVTALNHYLDQIETSGELEEIIRLHLGS